MTVSQRITKIYQEREKAHSILLKCDVKLDSLFKLLTSKKSNISKYENNNNGRK